MFVVALQSPEGKKQPLKPRNTFPAYFSLMLLEKGEKSLEVILLKHCRHLRIGRVRRYNRFQFSCNQFRNFWVIGLFGV